MNKSEFWSLIEVSKEVSGGDTLRQRDYLHAALVEKSIEDILDFARIADELIDAAYLADLWDAAAIIGCGCSDDGFLSFRAWLIQQGEHVYYEALRNPEVLIDIVVDPLYTQDGSVWGSAGEAYEEKTGNDWLTIAPRLAPPKLDRPLEEETDKFPKLQSKFRDWCV